MKIGDISGFSNSEALFYRFSRCFTWRDTENTSSWIDIYSMQTTVRDLIEAFRDAATVLVNEHIARLESAAGGGLGMDECQRLVETAHALAGELEKLGLAGRVVKRPMLKAMLNCSNQQSRDGNG